MSVIFLISYELIKSKKVYYFLDDKVAQSVDRIFLQSQGYLVGELRLKPRILVSIIPLSHWFEKWKWWFTLDTAKYHF